MQDTFHSARHHFDRQGKRIPKARCVTVRRHQAASGQNLVACLFKRPGTTGGKGGFVNPGVSRRQPFCMAMRLVHARWALTFQTGIFLEIAEDTSPLLFNGEAPAWASKARLEPPQTRHRPPAPHSRPLAGHHARQTTAPRATTPIPAARVRSAGSNSR